MWRDTLSRDRGISRELDEIQKMGAAICTFAKTESVMSSAVL